MNKFKVGDRVSHKGLGMATVIDAGRGALILLELDKEIGRWASPGDGYKGPCKRGNLYWGATAGNCTLVNPKKTFRGNK